MRRWLQRFRDFRKVVLGLNRRNQEYVFRYNDRAMFHLVDDKVATKRALETRGIPVPRTYAVYHVPWDLRRLARNVQRLQEFIIKPVRAAGGGGILAIVAREGPWFLKANDTRLSIRDLGDHIADILAGGYARNQRQDEAMIEYRIHSDPVLGQISYGGVADIRILVFLGVPLLAMLRLPTRRSDGRANLHMGGIGVGVDLANGRTSRAWGSGGPIQTHPDLGSRIVGVDLPNWDSILGIAARCYDATGLGYFGADVVIDADLGPLVLELNGRPGLAIQLANGRGLRPLLEPLETRDTRTLPADERVRIGRELFAATESLV